MIAVEVDVVELPGVLAALVAERCIRHDSRVFSSFCYREREVSERKSGEEDAIGFFGGTKQLYFILCSP